MNKEQIRVAGESFALAILQALSRSDGAILDTPRRVGRAWTEILSGYAQQAQDILTEFDAGDCDGMVVLRNCAFYSTCEHHLLPFYGVAHVGYLPSKRIVGVSKIARLLEMHSRRLQIQERIGLSVATDLATFLNARGAGCILEATHLCMACRGVRRDGATMTTSAMLGCFREDARVRAEFLDLVRA